MFTCPVAQRYRQRRAWKVSLLATIWKYGKSTCDSARPQDWLVTVKKRKSDYQGVVTSNRPVEPSATGIKIKSSDQELILHWIKRSRCYKKLVELASEQIENLQKYLSNRQESRIISGEIKQSRHIFVNHLDPGCRWFYKSIGSDYPLITLRVQCCLTIYRTAEAKR